jgi:cephalosporin hydroxylase
VHLSSYQHMERLVNKYLDPQAKLNILDIGSYDVNGSYQPLFNQPSWHYTGIDLSAGPNVDLVLASPYHLPLPDASADLIVSGQAFEHIEYFWLTWMEMVRVLKPNGMIFLLAPSRGSEHRYPVDCWRFYPDSYRALASYGRITILEVTTDWQPHSDPGSAEWGDTVGVFRKPKHGWFGLLKEKLSTQLHPSLSPADAAFYRSEGSNASVNDGSNVSIQNAPRLETSLDLPLGKVLPYLQHKIVEQSTYFGVPTLKSPLDFWVYQELIFAHRPDVIVEIGCRFGGSALALAHLCDSLGHGRIISLDVSLSDVAAETHAHPRITLIEGDACANFPQVRQLIGNDERVLVIEDSSHTFENTLEVLRTYQVLVKPGDYFIVEDSICYHGLEVGPDPGPYEAIESFIEENSDFTIDRSKEAYLITWNPKGYLKRIASNSL